MKAFHFRLQTKLNICQQEEQIIREEMQSKIMFRNQIQQELDTLRQNLQSVEQAIRQMNGGRGQFPRIVINRQYIPVITQEIRITEDSLAAAEEQVEKVRLELMGKMQETRTLEKLREKAWGRYLHELLLEEQKQIDEVAGSAHYRKRL